MEWIYLSPHPDDVALSCGGLVWEQALAGHSVSIWTVCAGDPPAGPLSLFAQALHGRWQTGRDAIAARRQEDAVSCQVMSVAYRHFPVPDCIYRFRERPGNQREYLYPGENSLLGKVHPADLDLVTSLGAQFARDLPADVELVCPLTFDAHVDHQVVRAAAESLGRELWFYADYPYILDHEEAFARETKGMQSVHFDISEQGVFVWQQSVEAHQSQISTFWPNLDAMRSDIRAFRDRFNGIFLWKLPNKEHS